MLLLSLKHFVTHSFKVLFIQESFISRSSLGPLSILMQGHSGQRNRDTINVFRKLKIALDLFLISIVYALIHIFIVTNPSSMVH